MAQNKIVYISYAKDGMTSLGIQTLVVEPKENVKSLLESLHEEGVLIVYVSDALYQTHAQIIESVQRDLKLTICVMGSAGSERLLKLRQSTLGLKNEKGGSA